MRLHTLNLANYRGFEQIELSFALDVTLIAGVNGVGKSGILEAIATVFSRALPDLTPSNARALSLTDDDIYYGKTALDISAIISNGSQRLHASIHRSRQDEVQREKLVKRLESIRIERQRVPDDAQRSVALRLEEKNLLDLLDEEGDRYSLILEGIRTEKTRTGELNGAAQESLRTLLSSREMPNQPVVIYFSPRRQLPGRPKTLPKLEAFEIANAYGFALQDREVELREFMHWFRVMEGGISKGNRHGAAILERLRAVVTSFVPEFQNLRIEESPLLRFVVEKDGTPLVLDHLSDGERGLLAILFDITRRLSIANPELDNPIDEGRGIILIDEIELHLHPLWQRQVLKRLKDTFKNCQFIVTTHSPIVLGEEKAGKIRFLDRDNEGRVFCAVPNDAYGLDVNRVLGELMGTRIRTREVDDQLKILFEQIDNEDFEPARETMKALREKLGENDPELTRASSLIKFLEGEL